MLISTFSSQAGITGFVARLFAALVGIQSRLRHIPTMTAGGSDDGLCRWFSVGGSQEQAAGVPPHLGQGRQGVERAWRAGVPRMRPRPPDPEKRRDLPEAREGEARRGRGVLLDRLQVARPS